MYISELQKRILKLLKKENALTTQVTSCSLNIPEITASRNLKKLTEGGFLTSLGKGRGVHYIQKTGATLEEIALLQAKLSEYRPFPPAIVESIEKALIGKFVFATNSIEGSKLTLRETDLILTGASIKGNRDEIQEVKNQQQALQLIQDLLTNKNVISEKFIQRLQKKITANVGDVFLNGKYRDQDVTIVGTDKIFPPAREVPKLMENLVAKITFMESRKQHPAVIATYAHYQVTAIHPFFDGNGRTARLLMNTILLKYDYPLAVIEFSRRSEYYAALQKADNGLYDIFQAFIFSSIKKNLELYLTILEI